MPVPAGCTEGAQYTYWCLTDFVPQGTALWGMLLFSHQVLPDSLWPHELQHTRLPCPSPSPGACSNSCPLSRWCHPTISPSVVPFSSCLQSFPASGTFPLSRLFTSGGQSIGAVAWYYGLPGNFHFRFVSTFSSFICWSQTPSSQLTLLVAKDFHSAIWSVCVCVCVCVCVEGGGHGSEWKASDEFNHQFLDFSPWWSLFLILLLPSLHLFSLLVPWFVSRVCPQPSLFCPYSSSLSSLIL